MNKIKIKVGVYMKSYMQILREKNVKPTIHRIKVLEYLDKNRVHPSADEIYRSLKEYFPTISRATVYNTLNLLSENKIVEEIITPDALRYDFVEKQHHHFYCTECRKVYDIHAELPELEIDEVEGHKVMSVQYCIVGICKECLEKTGGGFK